MGQRPYLSQDSASGNKDNYGPSSKYACDCRPYIWTNMGCQHLQQRLLYTQAHAIQKYGSCVLSCPYDHINNFLIIFIYTKQMIQPSILSVHVQSPDQMFNEPQVVIPPMSLWGVCHINKFHINIYLHKTDDTAIYLVYTCSLLTKRLNEPQVVRRIVRVGGCDADTYCQ